MVEMRVDVCVECGISCIDGIGTIGGGMHSIKEYSEFDSLIFFGTIYGSCGIISLIDFMKGVAR